MLHSGKSQDYPNLSDQKISRHFQQCSMVTQNVGVATGAVPTPASVATSSSQNKRIHSSHRIVDAIESYSTEPGQVFKEIPVDEYGLQEGIVDIPNTFKGTQIRPLAVRQALRISQHSVSNSSNLHKEAMTSTVLGLKNPCTVKAQKPMRTLSRKFSLKVMEGSGKDDFAEYFDCKTEETQKSQQQQQQYLQSKCEDANPNYNNSCNQITPPDTTIKLHGRRILLKSASNIKVKSPQQQQQQEQQLQLHSSIMEASQTTCASLTSNSTASFQFSNVFLDSEATATKKYADSNRKNKQSSLNPMTFSEIVEQESQGTFLRPGGNGRSPIVAGDKGMLLQGKSPSQIQRRNIVERAESNQMNDCLNAPKNNCMVPTIVGKMRATQMISQVQTLKGKNYSIAHNNSASFKADIRRHSTATTGATSFVESKNFEKQKLFEMQEDNEEENFMRLCQELSIL